MLPKLTYRKKRELSFFLLVIPSLFLFLSFTIYPLLQAINISFTDWNGLSATYDYIGFDNYALFFSDSYVLESVTATAKYTITVTIVQNIVALLLALALNRKFRGCNILRSVFFIPSLLSSLVVGYLWSYLYSDPIMDLGNALNIAVLGNNVLSSLNYAIFAAAFVTVWRNAGWTMMIYLAALQNVPNELLEAAEIDGASNWRKMLNITLPLIAPSFTINFILVFERSIKDFDSIFSLTNGGPGNATTTLALHIYKESFFYSRASYGTTIGVMLFLIIVVLTIIQLKFFQKGEQNVD